MITTSSFAGYTSDMINRMEIKEKLKLSERSYKCECCGIEIDRDYNAALNIKNIGKAMLEY